MTGTPASEKAQKAKALRTTLAMEFMKSLVYPPERISGVYQPIDVKSPVEWAFMYADEFIKQGELNE